MTWTPHIIYEDNHYVAISKPAGLAVQQDEDLNDDAVIPILQDFIGKRDSKPGKAFVGVIHRLDKPVTGVLLLAKTSKGQERANELLKDKKIKKYYLAITERSKIAQSGTLTHFFSRQGDDFKMSVSKSRHNNSDQEAVLKYNMLSMIGDYQLLAVELITGRRHQIRAQLNASGNPIVGDKRYGSKIAAENIYLHCAFMSFVHPIKHSSIILKNIPDFNQSLWKSFKAPILDWMAEFKDLAK